MNKCVVGVGILLSGLCPGIPSSAGEAAHVMSEVIVTPLRTEVDAARVPYTSFIIDREELEHELSRTTPDALRGIPSVMVQKTSTGQGSPFMRGFTGFRTLTMIEGIRLNNSVFRDGPNQYMNTIDPFSVERYELVLGPASTLYGSDAIGGALNVITPSVLGWTGAPAYENELVYRGATADDSTQLRAETSARLSRSFGIRAGYSWKSFGDLEGGKDVGKQEKTGYDEQDWDATAEYEWEGGAILTLGHQSVDQDDAWRTHRTVYGIEWEDLTHGDDQEHIFDQSRALTWLRLAESARGGKIDAYSLTLSLHEQGEDLDRLRANGRHDLQGFDVDTWGAALTLESDSNIGHWVYGADYYRDNVDSYSTSQQGDAPPKKAVQGPVADDATYDTVGVFVQDTVPVTDGGLEVTPGVRYTYAGMDAEKVSGIPEGINDHWDSVVGSVRALLPLNENRSSATFAGLSQGFRAPNLSDMTRLDTARSNEIETPVDELNPEYFTTAEIGLRHADERWGGSVGYYYTWIDDQIVRTPTGEIVDDLVEVTKKNSGEGFVQGVELTSYVMLHEDWELRFMGTWMDGRLETYPTSEPVLVEDDLSRVMPLTGRLTLRWAPVGKGFWAEGLVDAADDADKLSADDERDTQRIPPGGTPGYVVFTLRGGFTVYTRTTVTLALENLTDEDYRIHGSGVNEPGRQLVAQVSYAF